MNVECERLHSKKIIQFVSTLLPQTLLPSQSDILAYLYKVFSTLCISIFMPHSQSRGRREKKEKERGGGGEREEKKKRESERERRVNFKIKLPKSEITRK